MSDGLGSAQPAARGGRSAPRRQARTRPSGGVGDTLLALACVLAALLGLATLVAVVYEVLNGASLAIGRFGLGFLGHSTWAPNFEAFGAGVPLFGTAVTSAAALLLAVPLGVSIALFLSTVAPGRVRRVVGPLVEMLAAIPSVILGFWGVVVLNPFLPAHVEPFLHSVLGFIPLFGAPETTGLGMFNASLILTIMMVPIIASIGRDILLTVPGELKDGASALGATRWEVVRGVMLPSAASGLIAASFLGLGRALGEAIAVSQVIGDGKALHASLFATGNTLASQIALEYFGATSKLDVSSLFYLATILLAIGLIANLSAQLIVRRLGVHRALAR